MHKKEILRDLIETRRSIQPHLYNGQPITVEEITSILESAAFAPTHKMTQPWRFSLYQKSAFPDFKERLIHAMDKAAMTDIDTKVEKIFSKVQDSEFILLLGIHINPAANLPEWEEFSAFAMSVQNMWLTANSLNIGTYWSSPGFLINSGIDLGFEEETQCLGIMYFGKIDEDIALTQKNRNHLNQYVKFFK